MMQLKTRRQHEVGLQEGESIALSMKHDVLMEENDLRCGRWRGGVVLGKRGRVNEGVKKKKRGEEGMDYRQTTQSSTNLNAWAR